MLNPPAKLSKKLPPATVICIVQDILSGLRFSDIARKYCVSNSTVYSIGRYSIYQDITAPYADALRINWYNRRNDMRGFGTRQAFNNTGKRIRDVIGRFS